MSEPSGYLAIDLGQSRLAAGVVSADGAVVLRDRVATPSRSVWPALTQLVRRVLAANPSDVVPVAAGVTCPGPIDRGTGAMKPVGLPVWHDFPLRRELAATTGLPVHVDTAGRGLALAEMWRGASSALPESERFLATLALGEDVDGALVAGGRLLDGLTNNLGQFGHLIVEPDGAPCPCGASGCLTAYAGARAIEAATGRELRRTPAAHIDNVGIMVGRACATIAAMFDVGEIVVGGAVAEVLGTPFFDALAREFEQRSRLHHLRDMRVRGVASGQIGPLIAAAAVARSFHAATGTDASARDATPTDTAPDATAPHVRTADVTADTQPDAGSHGAGANGSASNGAGSEGAGPDGHD